MEDYTAQGWYEKHAMNAGAIIIIAIAASGVLMMRFRKRWLAKINIAFTKANHRHDFHGSPLLRDCEMNL
jgi:hypothetical protein